MGFLPFQTGPFAVASDIDHNAHLGQQQDQTGAAGGEEGQRNAGVGQGVRDNGDVAEHLPGDLRHDADAHQRAENRFSAWKAIQKPPNVDKIYEVYAQAETAGTILVKKYYDSDLVNKIKSEERIILKIHGTLDESSKMIFTRSQYTNARYQNAAFYRLLEALSLTHTFIFIGCGFSDPDIQLVLENYSFVFPGSPCHYFITSKDGINTEYKRIVKENRNLEIITYDSKDNHRELHDALEELVPMVEDERTRIAKEMDW